MSPWRQGWRTVLQTLLRVLPFPCRTGLEVVGAPGRGAPVLLTGNFCLTVDRVRRAVSGMDAYLLVADSRGVNVWCAATGGMLTDHQVIAALVTTGVGERVDHREVILPQLAATGIDGQRVHRATGWRVVWGPVEAADIPAFVRGGLRLDRGMRTVRFPWPRRLEMAVAWAFPISLLASALWLLWPAAALPAVGLVWGLSLLLFLAFPLYAPWLARGARRHGLVFLDFGRHGLPLVLWGLVLAAIVAWGLAAHRLSWSFVAGRALAGLAVVVVLSIDLMGSTPLYKSGLHAERRLRIVLDPGRCRGAAFCERVCPVDVFAVDHERKLATLPRAGQCVQCGACVVQCPFDALSFEGPGGEVVAPPTVRRFKLNLLGRRALPRG